MARDYPFELPYQLSGLFVGMAVSRLKEAEIWDELSEDAQQRLENAGWGGVEITKEDLDVLDDETYEKLRAMLP